MQPPKLPGFACGYCLVLAPHRLCGDRRELHSRRARQARAAMGGNRGARSPKMAMGVNKRDNSGQSDCGRLRKAIKLP